MLHTCILSYNHPQITAKCVQDTLKFVNADKLVLAHNGSRQENIDLLTKEFPLIEHFIIENNCGFSGGANRILSHLFKKTHWVFFVTNDCELLSAPIAPTCDGLYAPLLYRRKLELIDSIGGIFTPETSHLEHIREVSRATEFLEDKRSTAPYFYVPGTAFYIDQNTFLKLHGFDETLHTYWEDVDLSVRAKKLNLQFGIQPETKLIHKVGKTCHKDPYYTHFLFQRNKKIVTARYL